MSIVAFISDIHGNREALDAVLADIPGKATVYCLGDIIGYGADPAYCVETLMHHNLPSVLGNHDACLTGKLPVRWFSTHARAALEWQSNYLTSKHIEWLRQLPIARDVDDFLLVHGAPPASFTEYVDAWIPQVARETMQRTHQRHCAVGHTHIPSVTIGEITHSHPDWGPGDRAWRHTPHPCQTQHVRIEDDQRVLLNPGSVGQPRDRIPMASYALFDPSTGALDVRRIPYDVETAQDKIRKAALPPLLSERLTRGI